MLELRPRLGKRSVGTMDRRLGENRWQRMDAEKIAGNGWMWTAQNRDGWRPLGEPFVQLGTN